MKLNFNQLAQGLVLLSTCAIGQLAHAQGPGYLKDFKYEVANVTYDQAVTMMSTERHDTRLHSICSSRAHLWSYLMNQKFNVNVGKVFLFFADNTDSDWAYHVSPYIMVDGKEMVMDGGAGHGIGKFRKGPTPMSDWTEHYTQSRKCVVLDPLHNPEHLTLEQNIMPEDKAEDGKVMDPSNAPDDSLVRKFPGSDTVRCYVRKVPQQYYFPMDFYGADLAKMGDHRFDNFILNTFSQDEVVNACYDAMDGISSSRVSNKCYEALGFGYSEN